MLYTITRFQFLVICLFAVFAASVVLADGDEGGGGNILPPPNPAILSVSTVPPNGDVNPYGVAFVPRGFNSGSGPLNPGDILVSNFNDSSNVQGTGSTIVQITQSGTASVFFQGSTMLGLTTALGVLKQGFVIVGSVPTTDGTCSTIQQGELLILDSSGNVVMTLTDSNLLNGPWDLTVHQGEGEGGGGGDIHQKRGDEGDDEGGGPQVFVSNVLSGTVTRIDLQINPDGSLSVVSMTQIASGYATACNAAAVVVGPTGLAYDAERDTLYVASTDDNEIFAVDNAGETQQDGGTGRLVYQDNTHLHGPLALALAPNRHLLTANGDAINPDPNQSSEIVEFTRDGEFVSQFQIDTASGSAFGLALARAEDDSILFAAVDDNTNMLEEWSIPSGDNQEDFADVPLSEMFHNSVERIFHLGITAGCGGGMYCPDASVTRAQMAVFLLKAEHGSSYTPPPAVGMFADVPKGSFAADWIEQLSREGVTAGCGGGNYCPGEPVTRAQMAVFLLKAGHGPSYAPPACTAPGIFGDVACPGGFAVNWIERLHAEGVSGGCSANPLLFCSDKPSTRGEMAAFLVMTFGL